MSEPLATNAAGAPGGQPFIGVEEFERMSPDERLEALTARVLTDLDDLPDDFRRRIIATAQSL
ncbi:MAG TPA: hypothetical protein PKE05_09570 [Microthrixaceae bacterium]|nr:hypothetical protein [Microthrixaceae bacterium]